MPPFYHLCWTSIIHYFPVSDTGVSVMNLKAISKTDFAITNHPAVGNDVENTTITPMRA